MSTTKQKLRSLELYLSAHPDNEENSECAKKAIVLFYKMLENNDECTSTEMMVEFSKQENNAVIKRNEELEAMLEKCKSLFDQRQLPYERDCVEFSKEITELLNKKNERNNI